MKKVTVSIKYWCEKCKKYRTKVLKSYDLYGHNNDRYGSYVEANFTCKCGKHHSLELT